jgi:hypothetical protein
LLVLADVTTELSLVLKQVVTLLSFSVTNQGHPAQWHNNNRKTLVDACVHLTG